jgi:murein DD-endopeptidase MepM/ murein hydrolase activator NlpD
MSKGKYSVIIVPSDGGRTYNLSVSSLLLNVVLVIGIAYFALNGFFAYGFFSKEYQQKTIADLIKENDYLTSRIKRFSGVMEDLRSEYSYIVEKEKEIRTIFDLPEVNPQERALGIGGPVFVPEEPPSYARQITYDTENRLDELVRLSSFESEQFDTIFRTLMDRKDELDHIPSIMPAPGYVTRSFGVLPDPFTGIKRMHNGIDVCNRDGTPIYASADGKVEAISTLGHLGRTIIVDHGNGIKTYYGHISKATAKRGQEIKRGEKIAEMGNSGRSTGPHLHYSVRINGKFVNPMDYIFNRTWLAEK